MAGFFITCIAILKLSNLEAACRAPTQYGSFFKFILVLPGEALSVEDTWVLLKTHSLLKLFHTKTVMTHPIPQFAKKLIASAFKNNDLNILHLNTSSVLWKLWTTIYRSQTQVITHTSKHLHIKHIKKRNKLVQIACFRFSKLAVC